MGYQLIWHPRGVTKYFYGKIIGKDIFESVIAVEENSNFDLLRYVINDFTDVVEQDLRDLDIGEIAAIDSAAALSNPNIVVAVIASQPKIIAVAREYAQSDLNAYRTEIFANRGDAEAWVHRVLNISKQ